MLHGDPGAVLYCTVLHVPWCPGADPVRAGGGGDGPRHVRHAGQVVSTPGEEQVDPDTNRLELQTIHRFSQ